MTNSSIENRNNFLETSYNHFGYIWSLLILVKEVKNNNFLETSYNLYATFFKQLGLIIVKFVIRVELITFK